MGDDWAPGDLALCVRKEGRGRFLVVGRVYTVLALNTSYLASHGLGLVLAEERRNEPQKVGFVARYFRKIRPHTPDEEDAETIRLLQGKPVREPVS